MDSPSVLPESPMDPEDVVFPCKGCGEILEEGKAFELAGNRWHIDCFRCNTCGTLLDSDANLLLLGDGSLICNNCTYSCSACGNKIEDLAILTGDQAFCASCFRCRNCKRKIENLRYARTSQGIFCMNCHESLMARRRKKAKGNNAKHTNEQAPAASANTTPTTKVEKALPSLPPGAVLQTAFASDPETATPDSIATPAARSPAQRAPSRKEVPSAARRDVSPSVSEEARKDPATLPATMYKEGRPSNVSSSDETDERGRLSNAFDPTPALGQSQQRTKFVDPSPVAENRPPPRDYFNTRLSTKPPLRGDAAALRDDNARHSSRSGSRERGAELGTKSSLPKASPHIAYQEKGRQKSKRDISAGNASSPGSQFTSPTTLQDRIERGKSHQQFSQPTFSVGTTDDLKQDAPKRLKSPPEPNSTSEINSLAFPAEGPRDDVSRATTSRSPISVDSPNPFDDPRRKDGTAAMSIPTQQRNVDRPARGDSLTAQSSRSAEQSDVTAETLATTSSLAPAEHGVSALSVPSTSLDATGTGSSDLARKKSLESSPVYNSLDAPPPPRSSSRPSYPSRSVDNDDFIAPRTAPPPPPPIAPSTASAAPVTANTPSIDRQSGYDSISNLQSDSRSGQSLTPSMGSPGLPKHSADGTFTMEEEMARILHGTGKRESSENASSVLRRVSNAVKHGRSFSDRAASVNIKGPTAGPHSSSEFGSPVTISSPLMASSPGRDVDQLRAQLRRAQQRITELEAEKSSLEESVNSSSEIKQANSELREKRSTMAFLDTQREMVVRELEIMTAHLTRAKNTNEPLDINVLQTSVLREFADSLHKLKNGLGAQIEDLIHKRNELTDEITSLIQMKDKGFQEYESLSTRNAQLLEMNNQLVSGMQQIHRDNRVPNGFTNGLGIYSPHSKAEAGPTEVKNLNMIPTDSSIPNLLQETDAEPATMLTAPQVVSIRKGQPKKFNWRRGGEKMAKNVTKGIKGAFASTERGQAPFGDIGVPNGMFQSTQGTIGNDQGSVYSRQGLGPAATGSFGWQGQRIPGSKTGSSTGKNGSTTNLAHPLYPSDGSVLFGSELEARCEFEKRIIPAVVTRCVEEVESRGMEVEGVYRKSGGSGQVKSVQQGFEKDSNHDLSDAELEIHAVTSALKQYFRKLPTPLITYEVYDAILEAGQLQDREKQVVSLRMAVAELPEHHRNCLEYLVQHLVRVVHHQDVNLMTPMNLAVVFAPTIMRPMSIEREMSDMQAQRIAVQALLENHAVIFLEDE